MKTVFDPVIRAELSERINSIHESDKAHWGKMNIHQMLTHCSLWDEWILGKEKPGYKQVFIGKIFGRIGLRKMVRDDKPLDKNVPTSKWLKIKDTNSDIETVKFKWSSLIEDYSNYNNPGFIHDFFGKMSVENIGILAYKHSDHHLRQFGV